MKLDQSSTDVVINNLSQSIVKEEELGKVKNENLLFLFIYSNKLCISLVCRMNLI
jgi:hypothetical protein